MPGASYTIVCEVMTVQLVWLPTLQPVFRIRIRIRIRIHVFSGLPGPDPLVRGMDPDPVPALDPDPSIIKQI
jgi:hypothetical protein